MEEGMGGMGQWLIYLCKFPTFANDLLNDLLIKVWGTLVIGKLTHSSTNKSATTCFIAKNNTKWRTRMQLFHNYMLLVVVSPLASVRFVGDSGDINIVNHEPVQEAEILHINPHLSVLIYPTWMLNTASNLPMYYMASCATPVIHV